MSLPKTVMDGTTTFTGELEYLVQHTSRIRRLGVSPYFFRVAEPAGKRFNGVLPLADEQYLSSGGRQGISLLKSPPNCLEFVWMGVRPWFFVSVLVTLILGMYGSFMCAQHSFFNPLVVFLPFCLVAMLALGRLTRYPQRLRRQEMLAVDAQSQAEYLDKMIKDIKKA